MNLGLSGRLTQATVASPLTPSFLLFVATQRQFVRGLTMTGIKG